jgi:uncharacterized membrane protein
VTGGHDHAPSDAIALGDGIGRAVSALVLALAAITLIGLAVWWPRETPEVGSRVVAVEATVTEVRPIPCPADASASCIEVLSQLDGGVRKGEDAPFTFPLGFAGLEFAVGDPLLLDEVPNRDGTFTYVFADFQRTAPLLWLAGLFALAVIVLGRWRGVGALGGLVASFLVLTWFLVPALLDGGPVIPVAVVGAMAVAFVALYLAHGWSMRTHVALLGTTAALALTVALASAFVALTRLTGTTDEAARVVVSNNEGLSLTGLVLAGMVIGALGVLDDVTVTQVSAVWELRAANRTLSVRELFAAGVRIGRDHVASTVNTLVIAYAGAALPLLLLLRASGRPLSQALSQEVVAVEIVRALVGSIGLVAAVPITTGLAAVLAVRSPSADDASP